MFTLSNCKSHMWWKILFSNETKENEILPRLKGWVQIILKTWLLNFVRGFNKNYYTFCSFCTDKTGQNEAKV
jgi:hypothetical protein